MKTMISLLPGEGKYFKANLHTHTVLSDGHYTPGEIKEVYQKEGYSIIAYTDHNRYGNHRELNDENFLAIAAYEIEICEYSADPSDYSRARTYHINLYDKNPTEFTEEKESSILPEARYDDYHYINGFLERMRKMGFLTCYNHPYWSLQTYGDYSKLRGMWAMEIYNHGCEVEGLYGYNPQSYDEMLRLNSPVYCVATDDNHNGVPLTDTSSDSFGGFIMVNSPDLSYENVMEALVQGRFYSSSGPLIEELSIVGNRLIVRTSPVAKIYVLTQGRVCYRKIAEKGTLITEAEFTLTGKEGYIRVDCRDEKGLFANSNAYFLTEIFVQAAE